MASAGLQVLGLGNPLLDISAVVDADLLEKYGVSTRPPRSWGAGGRLEMRYRVIRAPIGRRARRRLCRRRTDRRR